LVEIKTDPEDARRMRIRATTKGTRLLQKGRKRRILDLATQIDRLSPEERAELGKAVEILDRLLTEWG
jgi:DNA-binding MarR family transcriptional regulator